MPAADDFAEHGPEPPGPLRAGDRLQGAGGLAEFDAKLGDWSPEWRYSDGYRRAAEVLTDHLPKSPGDVDALAMPILYCYRQSVELKLKLLRKVAHTLDGGPANLSREHRLKALWSDVRPTIERTCYPRELAQVDHAETLVDDLADLDPTGDAFRYWDSAQGATTLRPEETINLAHLATIMPKLEEFLDDVIGTVLDKALERALERLQEP